MNKQWYVVLYLSILTLAACGTAGEAPTLPPPTITPTPISTELPTVEAAIPAGLNADNPIQLVIVPDNLELALERESELEAEIENLTDIAIDVVIVETQAEAFALVCASSGGTQSAAWVDGMTYAAMHLQGCGVGILQAEQDGDTGERGVLLLNSEYEEDGLEAAIEDSLCRISFSDFYSWTLPVLFLATEDIEVTDLADVREVDDTDTLVADIARGACAIVGLSEIVWETYLDEDDSLSETVFVAETAPEFPYRVFAVPFSMALEVISEIETALLTLDEVDADDSEEATEEASDDETTDEEVADDLMTIFFGEGNFQQAIETDFDEMLAFLDASGINFAELGN